MNRQTLCLPVHNCVLFSFGENEKGEKCKFIRRGPHDYILASAFVLCLFLLIE